MLQKNTKHIDPDAKCNAKTLVKLQRKITATNLHTRVDEKRERVAPSILVRPSPVDFGAPAASNLQLVVLRPCSKDSPPSLTPRTRRWRVTTLRGCKLLEILAGMIGTDHRGVEQTWRRVKQGPAVGCIHCVAHHSFTWPWTHFSDDFNLPNSRTTLKWMVCCTTMFLRGLLTFFY